ncbi:hypothetical protein AB0E08_07565 [Streptomyces sp. NPDC048281]|uniref:hypothetical protein n=1 Tax=Streptomyces sp. NPDC048281 TaxID=3154715 RepID=UPI003415F91C
MRRFLFYAFLLSPALGFVLYLGLYPFFPHDVVVRIFVSFILITVFAVATFNAMMRMARTPR